MQKSIQQSLHWSLDDNTTDTFCVAGWYVLFTLTICTPTDNQAKGASERLGDSDWNIKKGSRQCTHAHRHPHEMSPDCTQTRINKLCLLLPPRTSKDGENGSLCALCPFHLHIKIHCITKTKLKFWKCKHPIMADRVLCGRGLLVITQRESLYIHNK